MRAPRSPAQEPCSLLAQAKQALNHLLRSLPGSDTQGSLSVLSAALAHPPGGRQEPGYR